MRRILSTVLFLTPILIWPGDEALAQDRHVISDSELRAAVTERATAERADREAIRSLLDREEVRMVASRAGLDLRTARSGVALLDGAELQRLSEQARELNDRLAGGQSAIVISTTTLIIALLIVLIILAAD